MQRGISIYPHSKIAYLEVYDSYGCKFALWFTCPKLYSVYQNLVAE